MAKEKAMASLSPLRFVGGSVVKASEAQDVIYQSNWSAAETCESLFQWSYEPKPAGIDFSSTPRTRFTLPIFIPPHWRQLYLAVDVLILSGTPSCRTTFDFSGSPVTISRSTTGYSNSAPLTTTTGSGLLTLAISLDIPSGTGTGRLLSLEVRKIADTAANLASPGDE